MTSTTPIIATVTPGDDADELAERAYAQLLGFVGELRPQDWDQMTECAPWTVRDMVAHMVGAAEGHASLPIAIRQLAQGFRHKGEFAGNSLDAMNEMQIRGQANRSGPELAERLAEIAPRAIRGRRRRARWAGFVRVPIDPTGSTAGFPSSVSMRHLCAVVLTRDVWMHKFDIARAVGTTPPMDDSDSRLVADAAAEWHQRHGQPVRLELSGPAGGSYSWGDGGPVLALEAVDFCRVLAGRSPRKPVPPDPLLDVRILF